MPEGINYGTHTAAEPGVINYGSHAPAESKPELPSVPEQVAKSLHNQAKGLFDTLSGLVDPQIAQKAGEGLLDAQVHEWDQAKESYHKGDYLGAAIRGLGAAVPIIGPMINQTAEKLSTPGQRAEGITDIAALPLLAKGIRGAPAAMETAGRVASGVADVAGKVKPIATNPIVMRTAGGAVGGTVGGAVAGAPGVVAGGWVGERVAGKLSDILEAKRDLRTQVADAIKQRVNWEQPQGPPLVPPEPVPPPLPVEEPVAPVPEPVQPEAPPAEAAPEPQAAEPRWDPSTLPPDPVKQTEWFKKAEAEMKARREGRAAPKEPEPEPAPKEAPSGPTLQETLEELKNRENLTERIKDLLRQEKEKAGFDPDRPLGEVKGGRYPNKFAGDDSPVIDSAEQRTSGSNLPVANPGMVAKNLAAKIGDKVSLEMFDRIVKNPAGVKVLGAMQQKGYIPDATVISLIRKRLAAKAKQSGTITVSDLMKR